MKKMIIILLFILSISIPYAAAHPFTLETIPNSSTNVQIGVTEVIVYFSEPIDNNFSSLKVFDSNGEQIDNKDTKYYEGDYAWIVTTLPW